MAISSAIAIYFVVWWVVLFAVLPFGVRSQSEQQTQTVAGSDPGAPVLPRMAQKLLWTTLISAAIFAAATLAYLNGYLGIERLNRLLGFPF